MKKLLCLMLVAAAGALLAMAVARDARAWTIDDAVSNGFQVVNENDPTAPAGCGHVYISGHGSPYTDLGHSCDTGFQGGLDGYMAQWCPCAATTATTTTTATTAAATTIPATTDPAPPAPPPTATTTDTTTTSATVDPAITDLQTRLSTLETQVATLQARVDQLVNGQTVTLAARTWTVTAAKNGVATLVATKKKAGEKAKPKRKVPSAVLVPLLAKRR